MPIERLSDALRSGGDPLYETSLGFSKEIVLQKGRPYLRVVVIFSSTKRGALLMRFVLISFLALLLGSAALAAPAATRSVHAAGRGTTIVKPDCARVFLGVESQEASIASARKDNSQRVQKIIDSIQALKIDELKMKTTDVNIRLIQPYNNDAKLPETVGYRISTQMTVSVREKDPTRLAALASKVLDAALLHGANTVQQVNFFVEDATTPRREALAKAVQDALENARAMAKGAGKKLGEVVTIQDSPVHGAESYALTNSMVQTSTPTGGADSTPMVAGMLEVSATVEIVAEFAGR